MLSLGNGFLNSSFLSHLNKTGEAIWTITNNSLRQLGVNSYQTGKTSETMTKEWLKSTVSGYANYIKAREDFQSI